MLDRKMTSEGASIASYLERSIQVLEDSTLAFSDDRTERAVELICNEMRQNRPLLVCGNGGSAADAEHIACELVGRFLKDRRALNAISLVSNSSALSAWANDCDYDDVFARQVEAYGAAGGALMVLSTSGNSQNVIRAAQAARRLGLPVIALTGKGGGELGKHCDVLLDVPCDSTPLVQQVHICLYHYICERIETLLT